MRTLILLLHLCPLIGFAAEQTTLNSSLATAANSQVKDYLEARQLIVNLGKDALSPLAEAASDVKLSWQQRLMARICYERILRGQDIEALCHYDWKTDPHYDKQWEGNITGVRYGMSKIVIPRCVELGLWYYYIELAWKHPGELSPTGRTEADAWRGWCAEALDGKLEKYYLIRAMADVVDKDPELKERLSLGYYQRLADMREVDPVPIIAIPILVKRHKAYSERTSLKNWDQQRRDEYYWGTFGVLVKWADVSVADLLEEQIASDPRLKDVSDPRARFKEKLAAIRSRPTSPSLVEPQFRLGQQPVKP